jgi:hypothetical protein
MSHMTRPPWIRYLVYCVLRRLLRRALYEGFKR